MHDMLVYMLIMNLPTTTTPDTNNIPTHHQQLDTHQQQLQTHTNKPTTTARNKRRRFRHRQNSFLPTPKVPASSLRIADVVCPLSTKPYSEQLLVKQQKVIESLATITKKVCITNALVL